MRRPDQLEFWFDPSCPWAWLTSCWIREVQDRRSIEVTWQPMSLAILNEGSDIPDEYRDLIERTWGPARLVTAAWQEVGADAVGPLYEALGSAIHVKGLEDPDEIIASALEATGLPADLATAAASDAYDAVLRSSHELAMSYVGSDVGTPVLRVTRPHHDAFAFFGPIVSPAPKGRAAEQLWDAFLAVGSVPGVYEIKRGRTGPPDLG